MPNPAFIVEGHMEQKFIKNVCTGLPVVRIGSNGENVSIERLCEFIHSQLVVFGNRHYPIYIILDRETREDSSDEIKSQLCQLLSDKGHTMDIHIAVPDRMIENWILADPKMLKEEFNITLPNKCFEGTKGKIELKRYMLNHNYSEVTDGFIMLKKARASSIFENSPSFQAFYREINLDCWWLLN